MAIASPATCIATVTVNAAFFCEIKEASLELWQRLDDLRRLCSQPAKLRGHIRDCSEMLEELRDQIALYFALEEFYGYFEDPVAVEPQLSDLALSLREEHADLYCEICDLVERVDRQNHAHRATASLAWLPEALSEFHGRIRRHEQRESELICGTYKDELDHG